MQAGKDILDPQLPLPLPQFSLGQSSLFHAGPGSVEMNTAAEPDSTGNDDGISLKDSNDEITQFRSSSGNVISLSRKKDDGLKLHSDISAHFNNISWKDDDSYGININLLLDKIAAKDDHAPIAENNTVTENIKLKDTSKAKNNKNSNTNNKDKLWVEKWRPRNFLDLVGNEKTNRRVLGWLRQWSLAVFKEDLGLSPFQKIMMEKNPQLLQEEQDDLYHRPKRKILLIHGPPGIGKTSVAHVVAKQAGYSISEINASDERAGPMMKHKIHNTLFNHTFNEKPVCLIADEIDGAIESGFVKVLLDILYNDIKATKKARFNKDSGLTPQQQKKSKRKDNKNLKTSKVLLRPIIAICNNLYAPALEKLRPFCEIVSFKRPNDNALQERLTHICDREHLNVSIKILKNLIDLAQGDVRNCINNLQFMTTNIPKQDMQETNTNNNVWESNQKDTSILWFKLVSQIFQRDPYKDLRTQFYELLSNIEQNGNYERIIQGCFNVYPSVKYTDNGVTKPSEIADWLYFHDLMQKSLYEQNGELIKYSSVIPLVFYTKFSDIANNKEEIRIKSMEYEMREKRKQNEAIVKSIIDKIAAQQPHLAETLSMKSLLFEILPYLNDIVSTDLIKIKNVPLKNDIVNTISDILRQYQLSLLPIENEYPHLHQSATVLGVSPPFNKAVVYDEPKNKEIYIKRPQSLHLLLAKSEEMKVKKRHLNQIQKEKEGLEENKLKTKKAKISGSNTIDFFRNQYDSINSQLDEQHNQSTLKKKDQSPFPASSSDTTVVDSDKDNAHSRVWVKYKAGFSNAVKKNVTWDTLWD
ncbi:chromosome transmission fidelity protein 18 [Monosporozyma servazzii]